MDRLYYLLNFIFPFILFLIGISFKRHKYEKIGSNGYSTPNSRKTQDTWDYAQKICPIYFIKYSNVLSILTLFVSLIAFVMNADPNKSVYVTLIMFCICIFLIFFSIESELVKIEKKPESN